MTQRARQPIPRELMLYTIFGEDCAESAIWGRYNENRNKLAMIYACSADYRKPVITADAAKWACELTEYSCRLMIKAIRENVADSACHKLALYKLRRR